MVKRKSATDVPAEFVEKVEKLVAINGDYATRYQLQTLERERYREKHPTKIMVFKCMDGRILFSSFTGTPLGLLRNFRNLGGQFNFGWRALRDYFTHTVEQCHAQKQGCLAIITYHYSKGDKLRGCAGYNYDVEASIRGAMGFKKQLERAYRGLPHQIIPIVVGIETDEEALVFHGEGEPLEVSKLSVDISEEEAFRRLNVLHEKMPIQMRIDLLPLLMNNVQHSHKIIQTNRPVVEMDHGEWIVGVGGSSAFDFLHVPNTAIIVGQYNPNLGKIIKKALGVIKGHWKEGNKFLTFAGASYNGTSNSNMIHEQHAMEDVRYYNRLIREIAQKDYPDLVPHMYQVRGLIELESQRLKLV